MPEKTTSTISLSQLSMLTDVKRHKRTLTRIQTLHKKGLLWKGEDLHSGHIMELTPEDFNNMPRIGKKMVEALKELQKQIPALINEIPESGDINSLEEAGVILATALDKTLSKAPKKTARIVTNRWGLGAEALPLPQIEANEGLTKERIRQIEFQMAKTIQSHLPIDAGRLKTLIHQHAQETSPKLPSELRNRFTSDESFYRFLEIITNTAKGQLRNMVNPKVPAKILSHYFAQNKSPASKEDLIQDLIKSGSPHDIAKGLLNKAIDKGFLIESEEGIYPKNLTKQDAIAHVLLTEPEGLGWREVISRINEKGCSKHAIKLRTQIDTAFANNPYIYLSARGVYKHRKFQDKNAINSKNLFEDIKDYLQKQENNTSTLNEYYLTISEGKGQSIDYFLLRDIVKQKGAESGIFLKGASGTDTISLTENAALMSQKETIVKALKEANRPLTKNEIAKHLRSRTQGHASLYIHALTNEGKIVQSSIGEYTLPEIMFKDVDVEKYLEDIDSLLKNSGKVVEISVIMDEMNKKWETKYSKAFFKAVIAAFHKKKGWHRAYSMVSTKEIPFKSIKSVIEENMAPDDDFKTVYRKLSNIMEITKKAANRYYDNVKFKA